MTFATPSIQFANRRIMANPAALRALAIAAGAAVLLGGATLQSSPAQAQSSCQSDFAAINKKLEAQVASLNALSKGKSKQIDPSAACPRLRKLSGVERELLDYMKKNQSWCAIPEDVIANFSKRAANTSRIAAQACKAAAVQAQMRRQVQQGVAPEPRPKLPAGPL